jgi:Ni,Fe-hydrogenase III large subunit
MPALIDVIEGRKVEEHRPWPRVVVRDDGWRFSTRQLAAGTWTLLGLWGEAGAVHMAVLDERAGEIAVVTILCPNARYPSVGALHPPAIRLERALRDLTGIEPVGLPDPRPWLDLGFWDVRHPLSAQPGTAQPRAPYAFLPTEGEGLHQIPVGPVHAGIIEPGHFRFTQRRDRGALERASGYVHRASRRCGGRPRQGSAACHFPATARSPMPTLRARRGCARREGAAAWFSCARVAKLERLANHFGDIGAVCNDASFSIMHAQCGILRENVLRAADACFGHRLMMDRVVPGGVATDLDAAGAARIEAALADIRRQFPKLVELYDNTASLQERTATTGILSVQLARQFGAGGYVGRASGRAFDARKLPGSAPYDQLAFDIPGFETGDVNARVWIRIREVEQSLALIEQILQRLPDGPVQVAVAGSGGGSGEGLGLAEAFRGDVLVWLRLDRGRVARCHLRDPSWFQWLPLEAAIEGNIVADFPLCNKSFNCSYSGHVSRTPACAESCSRACCAGR